MPLAVGMTLDAVVRRAVEAVVRERRPVVMYEGVAEIAMQDPDVHALRRQPMTYFAASEVGPFGVGLVLR
jgi:hypothetical protein